MDDQTEANRIAWNSVAQTHYEKYHIEKLLAGEPMIAEVIRSEV